MADTENISRDVKRHVNWNKELVSVLKNVGRIALRVASYVLNVLLTVILIGMITAVIVGTAFAVYIKDNLDLSIDADSFITAGQDTTTEIFYMKYDSIEDRINRNGTPVKLESQSLYGTKNSVWVPYSELPEDLIDAFVSVEDHRFFTHNGVDWIGTSKAIVNYFVGFESVRGASTITQQLVKNLTGEDDVTIQRKVEEIFRALNLEKEKSKEDILEMYLNIVFLGNNCYGVGAASERYFGKDVSDLSLVECAALAGIVKNPSRYEPIGHDYFTYYDEDGVEQEDGNKVRRSTVLYTMRQYDKITEDEYNSALEEELKLVEETEDDEEVIDEGVTIHSWYIDAMRTKLIDDLMEQNGWTRAVASAKLYTSGYKIYIPMDPEVQDIMDEVYVNDSEYFPYAWGALQPQSAMVITDPYTGDVLGLVGGRGVKTADLILNRATQAKRPVGSSIKPLSVYAPALDAGIINYGYVIDDTPVMFNKTTNQWGGETITAYPHNLPDVYYGLTTINDGVKRSANTVAMKTLQLLTVDKSFDFMKNTLHFDSLVDEYTTPSGVFVTDRGLAALGLGQVSYGLTVLEMAAGYGIFQNKGLYESPNLYLYVTDSSGKVVLENNHYTEVAISEESASIMTIILQHVMEPGGTGSSVTLTNSINVAGKTGSTTANFDRYFVGYTPYCVGAVWFGYDNNSTLSGFSGNPSATVWDIVMTKVHQKYLDRAAAGMEELRTFERAEGVIEARFCKDSGLLAGDNCTCDIRGDRTEIGYYTRTTVPTKVCDKHVMVRFDTSTDMLATDKCPEESVVEISLVKMSGRDFPISIPIADTQYGLFVSNDGFEHGYTYGVSNPLNSYCTVHTGEKDDKDNKKTNG